MIASSSFWQSCDKKFTDLLTLQPSFDVQVGDRLFLEIRFLEIRIRFPTLSSLPRMAEPQRARPRSVPMISMKVLVFFSCSFEHALPMIVSIGR